ncbi:hypothetical protein [Clostridium rectalis]|uniref:hypothetical protein n=1 Tax=Clostridium rectalis TaxID=2040295 RepID=UPI000F62F110|nr:hypothetical protein [Clostridium rectalis]
MNKLSKKLSIFMSAMFISSNIFLSLSVKAKPIKNNVQAFDISQEVVGEANVKKEIKCIESETKDKKNIDVVDFPRDNGSTIKIKNTEDDKLKSLKEEDVFYIKPSKENPFGYMGKVEKVESDTNEEKIIKVSQPDIDEIFSDLSMENTEKLTLDNMVQYSLPEGAYIKTPLENSLMPKVAASNWSLENIYNDLNIHGDNIQKDGDRYKINNIYIGFNDSLIYDGDGNENTKDDQIRLTGTLSMKNSSMDMGIKFEKLKWKELKARFITTLDINTGLNVNVNKNIDLSNLKKAYNGINNVENLSNLKGKNTGSKIIEFLSSVPFLKNNVIEGVDMKDKFIIGSLTFNIGTLKAKVKTGAWEKIPIGATIFITMDLRGNVQATAVMGANYSCYIDKGIYIQDIDGKNNVTNFNVLADGSYPNPNEVSTLPTEEQKNSKPKVNYHGEGKGNLNLNFGTELNAGIIIGGIVPVNIVNRFYGETDVDLDVKTLDSKLVKNVTGTGRLGAKGGIDIRFKTSLFSDYEFNKNYHLYHKVFWNGSW